jgi:hypothetical protein
MSGETYIVSVSGGLTSFEAWRRALEKHGRENVIGVFADVGEAFDDFGNRVCGEDLDLYRFLGETEELLGVTAVRLRSDKYNNIWDAFFGERMLGSTLRDPCSRWLKRRVINDWITAHFMEFNTVRCLGFSWMEAERAKDFDKWMGYYRTWHPLMDPPLVTSEEIAEWLEDRGIKRPRLYLQGYAHNNCGGFCVKMGLGQARDLWLLNRPAYLYHEKREQEFRKEINATATIFRRNENPITMLELREAFEAGYIPKTKKQICGGSCMVRSAEDREAA